MSNVNEGLSDIEKLKDNEGRLKLSRNSEMPTEFSVKAPNIELTSCMFKTNVSIQFVSGASLLISRNKLLFLFR